MTEPNQPIICRVGSDADLSFAALPCPSLSTQIIKAVGPGGASEGMSYPWFFPLLATLAAATSFIGLLFLTVCMKKFDATFSSAMFVGSFVVSASIMSTIHYSTFQDLKGLINDIMYPFGLLVLMAGVGILLQNTSSGGDDAVANDEACGYCGEILEYHESGDAGESGESSERNRMVSLVRYLPHKSPVLLSLYVHISSLFIPSCHRRISWPQREPLVSPRTQVSELT